MYNHLFKTDYDPNSGFSKARLAEEKEFAEKCFEAGMQRGFQNAVYIYDHEKSAPNFENFYSQFESVSKSG